MKTTISLFSVLTLVFFLSIGNTFAQKPKKVKDKLLAGKTFTVEITETTGKKVGKTATDEISFKSEKLNSKFMTAENHFPASLYTATVDSTGEVKEITFESVETNQDGEELKWEGTVTDLDIEGTAVISKKGKTKKEYSFTGTLKEKKGAAKK